MSFVIRISPSFIGAISEIRGRPTPFLSLFASSCDFSRPPSPAFSSLASLAVNLPTFQLKLATCSCSVQVDMSALWQFIRLSPPTDGRFGVCRDARQLARDFWTCRARYRKSKSRSPQKARPGLKASGFLDRNAFRGAPSRRTFGPRLWGPPAHSQKAKSPKGAHASNGVTPRRLPSIAAVTLFDLSRQKRQNAPGESSQQ